MTALVLLIRGAFFLIRKAEMHSFLSMKEPLKPVSRIILHVTVTADFDQVQSSRSARPELRQPTGFIDDDTGTKTIVTTLWRT